MLGADVHGSVHGGIQPSVWPAADLSETAAKCSGRRARKGEVGMVKRLYVLGGGVLAYLATASVALAQDPTQSGYGGTGGNIQGGVESGGGTGSGSLPFTGLDLLLLVGAGVLLLAAGLTLRRVGRARS
jgi:hypothetical protein